MAEKRRAERPRMGQAAARVKGRVIHSQALVRGAEGMMRFLLGAVLSSGEIFGGFAPFGVGFVASSGSGVDGLLATLGAGLGYLTLRGPADGLRYAAACVLVFSVAFAFYDVGLCKKGWFMPLVSAAMTGITGFVYLSDARWTTAQAVFFVTEILLAGVSAWFYRLALSSWQGGGDRAVLHTRQLVSLFFLLGTLLISLEGLTFFGDLSVGRIFSVVLVMALAHAGGLGYGAAGGVALGLSMDLAAGTEPFYAMAYGFSGLLTGAGWRQGRLFGALTYVVTNAVAVLWTWETVPRVSGLYEVFMASVLFLLLPQDWIKVLQDRLIREGGKAAGDRAGEYARERLSATAAAFRQIRDSLRSAFPDRTENREDPTVIFDRAAQRVCRRCSLRGTCWEKEYINTVGALNDALPAMLEKGKGEGADFPVWFPTRCLQFSAFLRAANEELTALRYRRQYEARLQESRRAVRGQYETLADILSEAACELSADLVADPLRDKKLRRHMAGLGLEGETAAYYDERGRLRLQATGPEVEKLKAPQELRRLSQLMGRPLRLLEERSGEVTLIQAEPLMAVAGVAARRREGQRESGDTGTWFKREDGSLFVLLCDGMGSGEAAQKESGLAVHLLEDFLRSGMDSVAALRTVNAALALKNEETGAFTTVDLLRIDLYTGEGELCKLGAAPTYFRRKGEVSRLSGAALPAGLAEGGGEPDVTRLELGEGDCVLLVSDGIADAGEDGWLREQLKQFDGKSPKELARTVMEESEKRVGAADDRTAVVITLRKREEARQ